MFLLSNFLIELFFSTIFLSIIIRFALPRRGPTRRRSPIKPNSDIIWDVPQEKATSDAEIQRRAKNQENHRCWQKKADLGHLHVWTTAAIISAQPIIQSGSINVRRWSCYWDDSCWVKWWTCHFLWSSDDECTRLVEELKFSTCKSLFDSHTENLEGEQREEFDTGDAADYTESN